MRGALRLQIPVLVPLLVASASCDDAELRRLEQRAEVRVIELRAIANNRDAFERERQDLEKKRTRLLELFAPVSAEALAAAVERSGGTVQDRAATPPSVAFRVDRPAAVRPLLPLDRDDGRPLSMDALRCRRSGCSGELVAFPVPPSPPRSAPTLADLPPRPWWPPARARWDRAKASIEQVAALRDSLGPVADVRDLTAELKALLETVELAQRKAALVVNAAEEALEAGASDVRVSAFADDVGYGARLVARNAGDDLPGRLGTLGVVEQEGEAFSVRVESPAKIAARNLVEKARK